MKKVLFLFFLLGGLASTAFATSGMLYPANKNVWNWPCVLKSNSYSSPVTIVNYTSDVTLIMRDSSGTLEFLSEPLTTSYESYLEFGPSAYLDVAAAIGDGMQPWPDNTAVEVKLIYNGGTASESFYLTEFMYYFFYPETYITGPIRIEIRQTVW